jgi:hypothetical protein
MRNKNEFAHGVWREASRVWEIFCDLPLLEPATVFRSPRGLARPPAVVADLFRLTDQMFKVTVSIR